MKRTTPAEIEAKRKRAAAAAAAAQLAAPAPAAHEAEAAPRPPAGPPLAVILAALSAHLEGVRRERPEVEAYGALETWRDHEAPLLGEAALARFEAVFAERPDDPLLRHHLAILHHGRGYDALLAGEPQAEASQAAWLAGLAHWAELVGDDGLWRALTDRWKAKAAAQPQDQLLERLAGVRWESTRRQLPDFLLSVHAKVALESAQADPARARRHVEIIKQASFEPAAIDRARAALLAGLTGDVEALCESRDFAAARAKVDLYLQLDADFTPALRKAVAVTAAECEQVGAAGKNVSRRIDLCRQTASRAEALEAFAREDVAVRTTIRDFYFFWGEAHWEHWLEDGEPDRRRLAAAREKLEIAVRHEGRGGQKSRELHENVCSYGADPFLAEGDADALGDEFLAAGFRVSPHSALLYVVQALRCACRGDQRGFDAAIALADQHMATTGNERARKKLAEIRGVSVQGAKAERLVIRGGREFEAERHSACIAALAQAERHFAHLSPASKFMVLCQLAVCHYHERNPECQGYARRALALMPPNVPDNLSKRLRMLAALDL